MTTYFYYMKSEERMKVRNKEHKHNVTVPMNGGFNAAAALHPGGTPSVGEGELDKKVDIAPFAPVLVTVGTGVVGAIVGIAVAFTVPLTSIGLYVLVASAEKTILPTEPGTDVLKAYAGVV